MKTDLSISLQVLIWEENQPFSDKVQLLCCLHIVGCMFLHKKQKSDLLMGFLLEWEVEILLQKISQLS